MIVTLERLGYGTDDVYDRIRDEIRKSPMFRFDWFLKSRTTLELSRRCAYLIKCLIADDKTEEPVKVVRSFVCYFCQYLPFFDVEARQLTLCSLFDLLEEGRYASEEGQGRFVGQGIASSIAQGVTGDVEERIPSCLQQVVSCS